MGRAKKISEDALLAAAMRVILRDGLPKLTLEAAAAEAGVSKGGVLYSYPSKDALLAALIRWTCDKVDADIAAHAEQDRQPRGRWLRAYLNVALGCSGDDAEAGEMRQLHAALVAAVAMNPQLLQAGQEHVERWNAALLADGVDPVEHAVTMYAIDGLMFNTLLGTPPAPELFAAVVARLKSRTHAGQRRTARRQPTTAKKGR